MADLPLKTNFIIRLHIHMPVVYHCDYEQEKRKKQYANQFGHLNIKKTYTTY
jgi:hypothetical protein